MSKAIVVRRHRSSQVPITIPCSRRALDLEAAELQRLQEKFKGTTPQGREIMRKLLARARRRLFGPTPPVFDPAKAQPIEGTVHRRLEPELDPMAKAQPAENQATRQALSELTPQNGASVVATRPRNVAPQIERFPRPVAGARGDKAIPSRPAIEAPHDTTVAMEPANTPADRTGGAASTADHLRAPVPQPSQSKPQGHANRPATGSPIHGYSMAEARRLGLA